MSRLVHLLRGRRDNDIVAGVDRCEIIGVDYDSLSDQIVLKLKDDPSIFLTEIVELVKELDRVAVVGLHIDESEGWYVDWRKRMAEAIGCDEKELNTRES